MPLYEYQCESCGHRFEKIRKFSDPPLDACPVCGGAVRKLFSSPAIQFKGTGWYITDYAKKSSSESGQTGAKGEGAQGGDKSDSGSKADSDSKTESGSKAESGNKAESGAKGESAAKKSGESGSAASPAAKPE